MISYLAFGSNMGDTLANLKKGRELLVADPEITLVASSKLYETAPYGGVEQADFLNGAIAIETTLDPFSLLIKIHQIEAQLGRERLIHWGPRTLDIDILLYGQQVVCAPELKIPHVELTKRSFVLIPLHDIYQETLLLEKPIAEWVALSGNEDEVKLSTKEW